MDLLAKYTERSVDDDAEEEDDQSESESESESKSLQLISLPSKTSAPKVDETLLALTADPDARNLHKKPIDAVQHVVSFNPTYDQLWAPIYGPADPYSKDGIAQGMRNHKLGYVESAAIHPFLFDEHYNTFHKYVGDLDALQKNDAVSIYNIPQHEQKKRRRLELKKNEDEAEEADVEASGPDAENPASEEWLKKNRKSPWAGKKEGLQAELTEEQNKYAEEYAEKKAEKEKGGGASWRRASGGCRQGHFPWEWKGGARLPGAVLDHPSERHQGHQRPLLHPQALGPHVERPHQGRICHQVLPQAWASAPISWRGYKDQDLGCVQLWQVYAHLHGTFEGGS